MTRLICVDPELVLKVWPEVRAGVARALAAGAGGMLSEIESDLLSGNALLWVAVEGDYDIRASCVTQLVKTDAGLKCVLRAVSGRGFREWAGHLSAIEKFAKDEGCVSVQLAGRKGWLRVLMDYTQKAVVMEKKL